MSIRTTSLPWLLAWLIASPAISSRSDLGAQLKDGYADLLSEYLKLADGGGAIDVSCDHQRTSAPAS